MTLAAEAPFVDLARRRYGSNADADDSAIVRSWSFGSWISKYTLDAQKKMVLEEGETSAGRASTWVERDQFS
jgi:hypothetical protein